MKFFIIPAALAATLLVTGCTTSSWIQAAGGVMQAKDDYDKQARNQRIRDANAAAARARKHCAWHL